MINATTTVRSSRSPSRLPCQASGVVVGGDEPAVHRRMQPRTLPGDQASGGRGVLDGVMALRLPRPHRFDVCVALGGLLGGVLLVVVGLGVRTSRDPITLFD